MIVNILLVMIKPIHGSVKSNTKYTKFCTFQSIGGSLESVDIINMMKTVSSPLNGKINNYRESWSYIYSVKNILRQN